VNKFQGLGGRFTKTTESTSKQPPRPDKIWQYRATGANLPLSIREPIDDQYTDLS